MSRIPLTLELYSLRDDAKTDLPGVLQKVAAMGYEGVEFAGYHGFSAPDLKKMLDDNGLFCSGTHTRLDTLQGDELQKTAEFNAILGNPFLVVPWVSPEEFGGREGAQKLGDALSTAQEKAAAFDAFVGYHNHAWEFQALPDGAVPMDLIFQNAHPDVVLQVDTGNALEGAGDPAPVLAKYKNRAKTVHLKPFAKDFSHYFIGEDDTNWDGVFKALEGGATQYFIIEQERYPEPNTPFDCVKRCLDNLKKMGK